MLHLYEIHFPRRVPPTFDRPEFGHTSYERALSSLDHEVGKILERIDLEQTVVVLHGDHGERFERSIVEWTIRGLKWHLWGWPAGRGWYKLDHGYHVYDLLVRVPLVFIGQGIFQPGGEIGAQVRQIDIMPTILEALGVRVDPEMNIHGRSLLPLIKGEQIEELPALVEACGSAIPDRRNWLRGVRLPPWKYVFAPHNPRIRPELYHLGEDPWESMNLIDQYPGVVASLRRIITGISSLDEAQRSCQ